MSSKYDLDKLLDPYGIDKIYKSIEGSNIVAMAGITNPFKDQNTAMQAAMVGITNPFKDQSAAMQAAMAGITNPFKDQSATIQAAMAGITNPFKDQSATIQAAMAGITNPFKDQNTAMQAAMAGITNPFKDQSTAMQAAMANITNPFKDQSTAIQAAMAGITNPFKDQNTAMQAAMAGITNPFKDQNTAMQAAMANITNPFKDQSAAMQAAMAGITNPFKDQSAAMDALSKYGSSLMDNKSLGLQADIQRLLAATTLMPELNTKVQSLHHKISNDLWIEREYLRNRSSTFIQDNQAIANNFNQIYGQNLHIDKDVAQAIDLVMHDKDALNIASELIDIGIFDTSSGSIIYDYLNHIPESKRNNVFIIFILPIILTIVMSISSEFEPIQSTKNHIVHSINNIKGHAVLTSSSFLKAAPNGKNILKIEKGTLIEVYENDHLPTGWVLVKLNKDNIDIKGYLNISDTKIIE